MSVRGIQPITRNRPCQECGEFFLTPHRGGWPPQFCSAKCHRAANPKAKAKPPRAISPASTPQRVKIMERACIVCAAQPCHPAHLIDKSLASDEGGDSRAVIPLCAAHHRAYDEERLSILEYLEPHYRPELAFAVERVGLLATLRRVTNEAWAPVAKERAA